MRRFLAAIWMALVSISPAAAGVACVLPFTITNGTLADASQVTANFQALVTCLGNAAAAGTNNDITSIIGLTTPLTTPQGGTQIYSGGTSTGSGNAQIISTVSPAPFNLAAGSQITWVVGLANNGPMQINVGSTGLKNLYRRTQLGISPMVGGETVVGHAATAIYDGTQFQLITGTPEQIGGVRDYVGPTAPLGWAFIDGSCQLRAGVFADLFSIIGTTYDPTGATCDILHFAMPDGRGRMLAGRDNMGGSAASRITLAGSGCVGTTLGGAGCGFQNYTVGQVNLPNLNFTVTYTKTTLSSTVAVSNAGTTNVVSGLTTAVVSDGTAASGGSGTAMTTLDPLLVVNKIMKY